MGRYCAVSDLAAPPGLVPGNGRPEILLFVLEEQSDPARFSVYKLAGYCLKLAELMKTDRVVPVVIFLRRGLDQHEPLRLGSERETFLSFKYLFVDLDQLLARQYFHKWPPGEAIGLPEKYECHPAGTLPPAGRRI